MAAAARVHRASFDAAMPALAGRYTPSQDTWFFEHVIYGAGPVWGAFDGDLCGIMALRGVWIDQLYVVPDAQARGAGTALIQTAKASSDTLALWTFTQNEAAQRFYRRHGFIAVRSTDGSRNEEGVPDILFAWAAIGDASEPE